MAGRLSDKVAIVTGATSCIGRAIALLFVKEGAKVVFAGRREKSGQELERELRELGGEAYFIQTDVTKTEDLQYLVSETVGRYGRIDVLVNNVGTAPVAGDEDSDGVKEYDDIFNVGIKSYLIMCREVLPQMIKQQKGSIINAASAGGEAVALGIASLAASKGAIKAFTRSLAGEYADQGVRVNSIMPGYTTEDMAPSEIGLSNNSVMSVPMGRAASPEEIAWGFVFFASDESSFCTGSNLIIDGGATAI